MVSKPEWLSLSLEIISLFLICTGANFDVISSGLKGIMIADAPGTTDTPRAHLVNPFALGESSSQRHIAQMGHGFRRNVC